MAETLYRAQILLDPEHHRALAELARQENRSLSAKVREIIQEYLVEREAAAREGEAVDALEVLRRLREEAEVARGVYRGDLVAETRAERELAVERVLRGEGHDAGGD